MTLVPSDQSHIWANIRDELDKLKAENAALKKEISALKHTPQPEIDAELMQALSDFDSDTTLASNQESAKKELAALLDDLEGMIKSLNANAGMGLTVPEKLDEIRNSLIT